MGARTDSFRKFPEEPSSSEDPYSDRRTKQRSPGTRHRRSQPRLPRVIGNEQRVREATIRHELVVDRLAAIRVQSDSGEVLQPQVPIAIDRGAAEPLCQASAV